LEGSLVPAVVVGAAIGLGAASVVGVGWAIGIGVAGAIGFDALMDSMVPDMGGISTSSQELSVESNPTRTMVVGETITSGPITKYEKRTIGDKEYHLFFVPLAAHLCESITLYQLDGVENNQLSGEGYRIEVALGDQTTVNTNARNEMENIDSTCVGYGVAYAYNKYEVNPDIFPNGVQDVKFKVKGILCYDPRKDSTIGGDGSHLADDETTWEWTDNAALINFYWKRFGGDIVLPIEMFDIANIAFEANLCDEEVTFTDKDGNTHTEKRWTCNGIIDLSQGQRIVEDELLKSCGGRWTEAGGKYWLLTAAYRGPATVSLTDDDLQGEIDRQPFTALEDRCNAVVAVFIDPSAYYQETNSTEIYSDYYRTVRDKRYLQHKRELGYTNSDTMCQRLNRLYMERMAAGDTLSIQVGWKGIKCPPGAVISANFKEAGITNKEFEVVGYEFDAENFIWSLVLQETAAAIYDDSVIPAEQDLTPGTSIDNTYVKEPKNVSYTPTPNDAWRQGVLTWSHDTPTSIRRYVVLITRYPDDGWQQVYYPTSPAQDINNLTLGDYRVAIAAENRFEKTSVGTTILFNVGATSTPTGDIGVNILPGRVIVTGPTPPNAGATYEWRYSFDGDTEEDFSSALAAGKNLTITITNTPHGGTVVVWYRLVNSNAADPNWLSVTIPNLLGVDAQEFVPETFALIQWPGLPVALGEHIDNITNDVNLWSTATSENGEDYQQLVYQVTTVGQANQINQTNIIGLKQQVGTKTVQAQISENNVVQIGYEDEDGNWIVGAPLARAFQEVKVTNGEGEEVNVISFMQALENSLGELNAAYYLGIIDENEQFTGLEIAGGNGNSDIHLYMDRLKFASKAGVVFFSLNTITGKLEIGADTEFKGTMRTAREINIAPDVMYIRDYAGFGPDNLHEWKGPPILDANGEPDWGNLTKANATMRWADAISDYFGGTISSGILKNSGTSTLLTLDPSVTVGPFTTNGNPKLVNVSFIWGGIWHSDDECPTSDVVTPSATVKLERSLGGGSWTTLQTLQVVGEMTYTELNEPEVSTQCVVQETTNYATTFTDTHASTGTFSYRLVVSNQQRYLHPNFITHQSLSLVITEEPQ